MSSSTRETPLKKLNSYITNSEIVWTNVAMLSYLYLSGLYGLYMVFTGRVLIMTVLFDFSVMVLQALGTTAGAHRLWSHRSYKANLPMRIFLCFIATMTYQNHIYEWARDHRVHHKFTETNADPHNAKRGFFFSHVGWLMVRKHKDVIEKGKMIDMSDLEQDGVVMFQKKYYFPLVLLIAFIMPGFVPWYFWGEEGWVAFWGSLATYIIGVNLVWLINSAAHLFGDKPYDKNIGPTNSWILNVYTVGENFHNYHHSFPWDYKASEFSNDYRNPTTFLIDGFAKLGWATELKTVSHEMIKRKALRDGDGSWAGVKDVNDVKAKLIEEVADREPAWGWGDECMSRQEMEYVDIINPEKKK